jgi:hypothetical protein
MKSDWDDEAKKMAAFLGEHLFGARDGIVEGPQSDGRDMSDSGGPDPFSFPRESCEQFQQGLERFREEIAASGRFVVGYDVDSEGGTVAMIVRANFSDPHLVPFLAVLAGIRRV